MFCEQHNFSSQESEFCPWCRIAELEAHNKTLQSTWEHGVRRRQELKSLLNQCARQIKAWMVGGKLDRRNHAAAKALIDLIELRIERGE